ncbi:SSH4 family protein [Aspergillus lucknowensis]|uniref:SPRY domain-containing protein n=1 Tax=Aspergillus lucknowensis TaxID=176173 RepID=A0ABR4LK07_9EURO
MANNNKAYAPPPGPPPAYNDASRPGHQSAPGITDSDPPPYHNWQEAVPDTTTFPPPPVTGNYVSTTGNASSNDADRAHEFCDRFPLYHPTRPSAVVYSSVQRYDIGPVPPSEFRGGISRHGDRWGGYTRERNGDCILLTNLPLYFASTDSPFHTEKRKTIYFEVKLVGLRAGPTSADASGLSIGFVAQPYPTWRSPGWERASLGIFSDDGCRFVNDSWGGKDFTGAFHTGETVGLGMTFQLPETFNAVEVSRGTQKLDVGVFFTRNGQRAGGWDLHEEIDEEAGGVYGLEGDYDLYAAVGLFGGVDFEVCYHPEGWLFHPER